MIMIMIVLLILGADVACSKEHDQDHEQRKGEATPLGFEPRITLPKGAVLRRSRNLFDGF